MSDNTYTTTTADGEPVNPAPTPSPIPRVTFVPPAFGVGGEDINGAGRHPSTGKFISK